MKQNQRFLTFGVALNAFSDSLIKGHNSISIASAIRINVSSVGLLNSCSTRLIMLCDNRARFATAFMDSPKASRFSRSNRTAIGPTMSALDLATPHKIRK
jgi:hypothetical protein